MNFFDITLLVIASVLVIVGMVKGLVRILIGLAALVAAFVMATQFHQTVAAQMQWINLPDEALKLIAYALIFIGVILLGAVIGFVTRKLLKVAMLGWADRLGGAALGLAAATLAGALVVLPLVAYAPFSQKVLTHSVLAPYVAVVADLASSWAPANLTRQYEQGIQDLRRQWRGRPGDSNEV